MLVPPIELKQTLGPQGWRLDGHLKKSMNNYILSHFMPYLPSPLLSPATINWLLFILPLLILLPSFPFILVCVFFIFLYFNFFPNPFDHLPSQPPSSLHSCVHGLFHFISVSPSLLSYYVPTSSDELNLIPTIPGPDLQHCL